MPTIPMNRMTVGLMRGIKMKGTDPGPGVTLRKSSRRRSRYACSDRWRRRAPVPSGIRRTVTGIRRGLLDGPARARLRRRHRRLSSTTRTSSTRDDSTKQGCTVSSSSSPASPPISTTRSAHQKSPRTSGHAKPTPSASPACSPRPIAEPFGVSFAYAAQDAPKTIVSGTASSGLNTAQGRSSRRLAPALLRVSAWSSRLSLRPAWLASRHRCRARRQSHYRAPARPTRW